MNAAEWNDPGKITLLLQYGANPKLRNDNGDTALDMARRNPSNESVLALTGTAPKRRYPRGRAQTVH
jgi:ankyrin repeat protein